MNHWGLIVVKPRERSVTYYESLKRDGTRFLNATLEWLKHEAICKKGLSLSEISAKDWDLIEAGPNQPQQEDDTECGVFVCINADSLDFRTKLGCDIMRVKFSDHYKVFE